MLTAEVERVFREVYGHAVATLIRIFGDIGLAEDAVQDAFVVATVRWASDGIPPNPAGWIVTTARRRAIDDQRRSARGRELARTAGAGADGGQGDRMGQEEVDVVDDDRLRLIFTCCHPALRPEHQVALTLRLLGGLSVPEVARAFLVSEATMAKRLTRARFKIKAGKIPYRIPESSDLEARLSAVLSVLYLIYNAGTDDVDAGKPLRAEAIRLARSLSTSLPGHPEAAGLVALMLLNEARMPARRRGGEVVLLRDQDRGLWDRAAIDEGHAIVRECLRQDQPGPFQVQAAIQAVHGEAQTFAATDWAQIVALYDHLHALTLSPVVALNRAIAVAEVDQEQLVAAAASIDGLSEALDGYGPFHAARASMLERTGRFADAAEAYQRAASLTSSLPERRYLSARLDDLNSCE